MRKFVVLVVFVALTALAASVSAQPFVEDPTIGLTVPTGRLAGEHDASAVVINPAGLNFLSGGRHFQLVLTGFDSDFSRGAGSGVGLYVGNSIKLPFLPPLAFGFAIERVDVPESVTPDPGTPLRLTVGWAFPMGLKNFSFGLNWHRYLDSDGPLRGLNTFDVGISGRMGAHFALGAVVRDVTGPNVSGVPVQRRYDLEFVVRPFGTHVLELSLGGQLAERRQNFDPRVRVGLQLTDALRLRADTQLLSRWRVLPAPGAPAEHEYDLRATVGLEVNFSAGARGAAYTTLTAPAGSDPRLLGAAVSLSVGADQRPNLLAPSTYLARVHVKSGMSQRTFIQLVLRLRRMSHDSDVAGVVLIVDSPELGWASAQELRASLKLLKKKGKKVFAFLSSGSTRDYYLAAVADHVFVDPGGGVRLRGFATTVVYYKTSFQTLGISAEFEKIDEYKSAPEVYTRSAASVEARAMRNWLMDSVYAQVTSDLAADRGVSKDAMQALIDNGPYTATDAKIAGLVDAAATPREVDELIAKAMGRRLPVLDKDPARAKRWTYAQIAVVVIDGDIVSGKSQTLPLLGRRLVGSESVATSIAWARQDPNVKAIVLRINSPGGMAFASEIMSREVFATRGKKPIIVSMGDVAASGGYFAAAGADVVFASPSTITGSIGIFAGKFDLSRLLDRLGWTWETFKRGQRADMYSIYRPFSDDERKALRKQLEYGYKRFIGAVAKGRKLTEKQVDSVGRGRVWTGSQAKQRQLVDKMGGIGDAIAYAKGAAGYSEHSHFEIVMLPRQRLSVLQVVGKLTGGTKADSVGWPLLRQLFRAIPGSLLFAPSALQARLPFSVHLDD